jgi:hypothetical protein
VKSKSKKAQPVKSVARAKLAGLIAEREQLLPTLESLGAAARKIESQLTAAAPLESQLATLDAAESAAMSEWAKTGAAGPAPKSDAAKRATLKKALTEARASAGVATSAYSSAAKKLESMTLPIRAEIAAILIEESELLIAEFAADNRKLHAKAVRLGQVRELVDAIDREIRVSAPSTPLPFSFGDFVARLQKLFTVPAQDDDAASVSRLAWNALHAGLFSDASTKLEIAK